MRIRPAEPRDIPRIGALLYTIHAAHADLRPDIFIPGRRKYDEAALEALLQDRRRPMWVAEEGGSVLGYCLAMVEETAGQANMADRRVLYIDDLCVDEAYRGRGIGSALCREVMAAARAQGFDSVTLNVWTGNDGARRLYEKLGFAPLKTTMEMRLKEKEENPCG